MGNPTFPTFQLPAVQGALPSGKVAAADVEAFLRPLCATFPPVCTTCGNQRWNVLTDIVKMPFWLETDQHYTYPAIALACTRCGFLMFFNAVQMGFVPAAQAT